MKWLLAIVAGLAFLCAFVYVLGIYLLGMTPRKWVTYVTDADPTPLMYDGKESYEEWATKMERARQAQAREERDEQ